MSEPKRARRALRTLDTAVAGALTVVIGYLGLLTLAAWVAHLAGRLRRGGPTPTGELPRFVVLIPAHDEERLIGSTLDSLAALDYPSDRYEVHVVADNCTDGTVGIARGRGVAVHERHDTERPGKGHALTWLLGRLDAAGSEHDAVVFVDADTVVDRGFLREVAPAIADGAPVVQGRYAVRDAAMSPTIAFRAAALAARNHLRPLGRTQLGGTAGLYGNGMVFHRDVLRRHGWSAHLTEDAELQLELLAEGVKVAYVPAAVVEAEMPATLDAARTQHERWEQGRLQLARRFVPQLARGVVAGGPAGRVAYADAALDTAVPPFSVVVAGSVAWSAWAAVRRIVVPTAANRRAARLGAVLLVVQAVYVLSALRLVRAPAAVYRSLLGAPRMVAWKLGLFAKVLLRPRADWVRTARNEDAA